MQAASGVKWMGLSAAVKVSLQFLQLAVLARLLTPSDFGLMAMVMVVTGFAQSFADMGISNAIIHRQDATREQLSSLYWLNIFAGILVFLLIVASMPLIVNIYNEQRLYSLLFWASLIFLIIPFGQQFQILLQKELQFNRLANVEITATAIGSAVAIVSAIKGQGVFSLVWGQLSLASAKTLLLMGSGWNKWRPDLRLRREDLKGYVRFGLFQMGERSVNYFSGQLDKLLIGALLGAQALGYYYVAYQLILRPFQLFNPILSRVAFPIFAKIQTDNKRLCEGYLELTSIIAMVLMPVYLGLIVLAEPLLTFLLGSGWDTSVSLLKVLAILGLLYSLGNPLGSLLLAKGRAEIGFYLNVLVMFLCAGAVWLGSSMGLMGIAWALVIVTAAMSPIDIWIRWRFVGMRPLAYIGAISPFLLFTCIVAAFIYCISLII